MSRTLLILRPEPGSTKSAAAAQDAGFNVRPYPLFEIAALPWDAPDPALFDAILLTSANAVRQAGAQIARFFHLPAFAVGEATGAAAREAGFGDVSEGVSDAQALVPAILARDCRRTLHLAGAQVRRFDAGRLQLSRVAVYESRAIGDEAGLNALITPGAIIMVHSPRAGRRLATLIDPRRRKDAAIVAISDEALSACGPHWAVALAAPTPDDKALLALAAMLCL